ncbi:MAG: sigma-70 family RNA polymerase sigma factor [Candidatus Carsonella ruddii]
MIKNIKFFFFKIFNYKKKKINKKTFFFSKIIISKNFFKKKKKINKIIFFLFLNIFSIKKINKKIFFLFKNFFFKKKIIKKNFFLLIKNYFLYKKKINIFLLNYFYKIFKNFKITINNNNYFIIQFINNYFINLIKYFLFLTKIINNRITINNLKILFKILKKYKKNIIYNDLYQECYIEFKKIINKKNDKKNFFKHCYWKLTKKMITIINIKKIKNNFKFFSVEKPLFYHSLKYFLSEKERNSLLNFAKVSIKNLIREIIINLPKREQQIIRLRFSIGYNKFYTLEEIGTLLFISKERVRQIELSIILKIRTPIIIELLKPYVKLIKILE